MPWISCISELRSTSTIGRPRRAAAAADWRLQFDWMFAPVTRTSGSWRRRSPSTNSSWRVLLPPKAIPVRSSRLTQICGPPSASDSRGSGCRGVGRSARGVRGWVARRSRTRSRAAVRVVIIGGPRMLVGGLGRPTSGRGDVGTSLSMPPTFSGESRRRACTVTAMRVRIRARHVGLSAVLRRRAVAAGCRLVGRLRGRPQPPLPAAFVTLLVSSNWAGYVSERGPFTSVTGHWTVPSVSTAWYGFSAVWLGIGGVSDNDLIQVGTEQDSRNGRTLLLRLVGNRCRRRRRGSR